MVHHKLKNWSEENLNLKLKKIAVLLAGLLLFMTACNQKPEDAVVKVNNKYLTQAELDQNVSLFTKLYLGDISDEEMDAVDASGSTLRKEMSKTSIEVMIMEELMRQDLAKNKIEITEEDKTAEKASLEEYAGGADQFKSQVEAMGMTEEDITSLVEKQTLQKKHQEWYLSQNKPEAAAVTEYYEANKDSMDLYNVAHILVDTEEEAAAIKTELDGGADFAAIAKEKSTDTGSAERGGELGDITMATNFVTEFLEAVKTLKEGETSGPVQSQYGYHLIKLNKITTGEENFVEQIEGALTTEAYNAYISELSANAKIENYKAEEFAPVEVTPEEPASTDTEAGTEEAVTEAPAAEETQATTEEKKE